MMRMFRYVLPLLAVLAGCKKVEQEIPVIPEPESEEATIVFVSERPQTDDPTRTHWDGTTILWDEADFIRMGYTVNGKWQNATGDASATDAKLYGSQKAILSEDGAVASFSTNVNFTGTTQGEHIFYAVYPGNAVESTMTAAPVTVVTLPSTQTPLADSFDRLADLMLGHSIDEYTSRPETPVRLVWDRVVAHGQITLKALPGAVSGEKVTSITLTGQEGANLVGKQNMNIITGEYAATDDNTAANKIVVKGDNLTIDANGNVTFWIAILPVNLTSLTVEVATNKATYTRSISGFTREFIANRRNILPINMAKATRTSTQGPSYQLVTSADELGEGHYLIAYTADGAANVLSGKGAKDYGAYASGITVANDAIEYAAGNPFDIEVSVTSKGYSLKLGNTYLGYSGSGNNLFFNTSYSATRDDWAFALDENGNAVITSVYNSDRFIKWNGISGQERFSCYTTSSSNMKPVQLYKLASEGPSVVTKPATDITSTSAVLHATFSQLGTTNVQSAHFRWGTSADKLTNELEVGSSFNVTTGEFQATLSSLANETTYYYQAVLQVYDEEQGVYVTRAGAVLSFTTEDFSQNIPTGWLELPAVTGNEDYVGAFYGSGAQTDDNRNYTYYYDYTWYASLWVAYPLNDAHTKGKVSSNWKFNPNIPQSYQVNMTGSSYPTMYGAEGYSKGHQIPNADRQCDNDMNQQTYYVTNQTPQIQNKFNGSIWGTLETDIRSLVSDTDETIYIVTGPVYQKVGGNEEITYLHGASGRNAYPEVLPVPNYYWKAILRVKWNASGDAVLSAQSVGFWFDHREYDKDTEKYPQFAVSVDQIEAWTGFDLFTNLPGDNDTGIEKAAETNSDWTAFQSF